MESFTIKVAEEVLRDLSGRLNRTRWPDEVEEAGWDYGTSRPYLQDLVKYWLTDFDWRVQERLLNRWPQFSARIDGLEIHFVHVRGSRPNSFPIVLTHGWPSSFFEMYKVIGPLSKPEEYGADPANAFDIVVPSLPGFGFSDRPIRRGLTAVDSLWRKLMTDVLGYPRFGAYGGDIGARVTSALGRFHADVVAGIQLGSVDLEWPDPLPKKADLSDSERDYLKRVRRWEMDEGAYGEIQATRPQSLSYGLSDSPAGLAAWIVEKFRTWSDCDGNVESRFTKDELLTNIMIYWVTETIGSSMRRYYEARHGQIPRPLALGERIETPTGIAMFPGEKDLVVPREWAERCYNVQRWTDMPRGGHFPAMEEPELLVEEIRHFFGELRDV